MSDTPAAKRKRTEGTALDSEVVRSTDIWYDDGSVILQAESTQFRVHWTVLAQHSSVFSDMRAVPQPPDEPLVEGCPVIQLSDSIQDLQHLLRALYNPLFDSTETLEFPVVAAIVRLGKKYDFKQLLGAAVARLTAMFPPTLAQIRKRNDAPSPIREDGGLLFDAINLANETGLLALLPSLYFETLNVLDSDRQVKLRSAPPRSHPFLRIKLKSLRAWSATITQLSSSRSRAKLHLSVVETQSLLPRPR